ncbi:zinc-ribbon domain-containing protein [Streptomyces katrae]|uniref:zinc-ribbon domain-containing protein n=1 Tax=Streptomyces katrae TaxID=68223 RepID=UPI00131BCDDA|nr:zinc-ribbon domain-containing protein [Streptomyces katrae]
MPKGQSSLAERAPHLLAEWHPRNELSPDGLGPGSQRKVWWQCPDGHEYQARIANRSRGTGCPECARAGRTSEPVLLADLPELLRQVDPDTDGASEASQLLSNARERLGWICPQGHRWQARVRHRAISGSGCPQCAGKRRSPALRAAHPDLAAEWHPTRNTGLDLAAVTAGSHRVVWWQCCSCGAEYRAKVFHRVRGLARCPGCSERVRYQDLATESPQVAALWHPDLNGTLTPAQVKAGANITVWWLCPAGHEPWSAHVAQVYLGYQECPRCRKHTYASRQEIALFAELEHVLTGGEQQYPLRTTLARYRLDMVFPADEGRRVVVEFDGSYWHRDTAARDRRKADDIEEHQEGWMVVRVREDPLELLRPSDVALPFLADPFTAASVVLDHLMAQLPWPAATRARARAYTAGGRALGQELAKRLISERRPAGSPPASVPLPRPSLIGAEAVQQQLW